MVIADKGGICHQLPTTRKSGSSDSARNCVDIAAIQCPVRLGCSASHPAAKSFPLAIPYSDSLSSTIWWFTPMIFPAVLKGFIRRPRIEGGELLVRRAVLEQGLLLYQSRGLVERRYTEGGLMFAATERTAAFLMRWNATT